jgi:hypothetical protein
MGTDKVIFVGEQWGATGSHVTGRDPVWNRKYAHAQPEICNAPSGAFSPDMTGSDRVRNRYILYYYQSSITSTMVTCDRSSPEGVEGAFLPEVGYRK